MVHHLPFFPTAPLHHRNPLPLSFSPPNPPTMVHSLSFSQIAPWHHRYSRRNPHRIPPSSSVPAPAGAFSVFTHCRSNVCSRRSSIYISPLPQQCLLPLKLYLYFPTAAAVSAPTGAFSVFPHCRSSVCSRRSPICISPLPQPFSSSGNHSPNSHPTPSLQTIPTALSLISGSKIP